MRCFILPKITTKPELNKGALLRGRDCAKMAKFKKGLGALRPDWNVGLRAFILLAVQALDFFVGRYIARERALRFRVVPAWSSGTEAWLFFHLNGHMHPVCLSSSLADVLTECADVSNGGVGHLTGQCLKSLNGLRRLIPTSSCALLSETTLRLVWTCCAGLFRFELCFALGDVQVGTLAHSDGENDARQRGTSFPRRRFDLLPSMLEQEQAKRGP